MKSKNCNKIKVTLMDYANKKTTFTIKDLDKAMLCMYQIISGDEFLTIIYTDKYCATIDSCRGIRIESICDEEFFFLPSQLEKINELKGENTYRRARELRDKIDIFKEERIRVE